MNSQILLSSRLQIQGLRCLANKPVLLKRLVNWSRMIPQLRLSQHLKELSLLPLPKNSFQDPSKLKLNNQKQVRNSPQFDQIQMIKLLMIMKISQAH